MPSKTELQLYRQIAELRDRIFQIEQNLHDYQDNIFPPPKYDLVPVKTEGAIAELAPGEPL